MGKKYLDTKENSIESAVMQVWQEAAKLNEYQKVNGEFKKVDGGDGRKEKKMKTEKKLDPVGKADADIDNDGDVDSSDKYLKKRRAAIGKAMKEAKQKPYISSDRGDFNVMNGSGKIAKSFKDKRLAQDYFKKNYDDLMKEGLEDSPNPANSQHLCAKNVVHEEWGAGQPVHGMHDTPDDDGNIAWYDVMFEHGIEKGVSINELKVTKSESHHHGEKKKDDEDKEMLKAKKEVKEYYEIGTDRYRDHTLDVTPGQDDPEWVAARDFKVASMKEALAKVWGLDEKALDKSSKEEYDEEDEELKPVKGSKTMTGGKVAKVEIQPKIDG